MLIIIYSVHINFYYYCVIGVLVLEDYLKLFIYIYIVQNVVYYVLFFQSHQIKSLNKIQF